MKSALKAAQTAGVGVNTYATLGLTLKVGMIVGWAAAILLFVVGSIGGQLVLALVSVLVFSGLLFLESGGTFAVPRASVARSSASSLLDASDASAGERRITVSGDALVQDAASVVLASRQPDFAVVQGGSVLGVVTRSDIVWALVQDAGDAPVVSIMRRDVPRVDAGSPSDEVGRIMIEKNTPMVAVFDGEKYLGLVKHSDIAVAMTLPQRANGPEPLDVAAPVMTRKVWT
jgi:CBS domain-containing protein